MYESTTSDASALLAVKAKWEASANLVDPLKSTEASLMKLGDKTAAGGEWSVGELHKVLQAQIDRVEEGDMGGLEATLACQAHVLHMLFTRSVDKYAGAADEEKSKVFVHIALKSQNYCRMALVAIAKMKEAKAKKQRNELLNERQTQKKFRNELLNTPNF